jgi:drug/metabolite transporter (DMT)-like permease
MSTPALVLIMIGILLVILAIFVEFMSQIGSSAKDKVNNPKKLVTILFIIGLSISLGAFLMLNGSLRGENIIGIVGILLIGILFMALPFIKQRKINNKDELQ